MMENLNKDLRLLSQKLNNPLYVVGGAVRNYLIEKEFSTDVDICSNTSLEEFLLTSKEVGFEVVTTYPRTATVVIKKDGAKFEYTAFRREEYKKGGEHTPVAVNFTDSIEEDARRRDFKCNAVYYDIKNDEIVDPLGGVNDIKNKILDTVTSPEEVFSHDGLRLMRLARFCGELGFAPTKEVIDGAKKYAQNIVDISAERVFDELKKILVADQKYPFSSKTGHYDALKILDTTGVLDYIIPELTEGRGMAQRSDFHNHDVLEHSLRTVLYAPRKIRLSALLHDVGKPYCMRTEGKYYNHDLEGARIAEKVLKRLKAPTNTIKEVVFGARFHMLDLDLKMRAGKVRRFIAENYLKISDLLALKQADYSACKDDLSTASGVKKWRDIIEKMEEEKVPTSYSMLAVRGDDLVEIGCEGKEIKEILKRLFLFAVDNPKENQREKLLLVAKKWLNKGE